jgi:hypothetical protein
VTPLAPISSDKTSGRIAAWVGSILFPLALYIAGFLVFFRWQIFSNFDLAFGDRGDGRLITFIHEHVYRSLLAHSGLLSPPFFFNQANTLGYSDALLLDQVIYAPLRLLGADPLLALTLTPIILSPIAYLFVYLFLRRLDVSVPLSSFATLIFTFANNLFLKSIHPVFFAVYYIPIVAYCGFVAISELHRRPLRACLLGAFAAGLFGLLFSTSYYIAWFFGLALLIFAPIAGYIAWPQLRAWWSKNANRVLGLALAASLSFLAALSIFVMIYAPVLAAGATRTFGEYLYYAPEPLDIINVGMDNIIWSRMIRSMHLIGDDRLGNVELRIAMTPIVQILLLSSAFLAFHPRFWPDNDRGEIRRALVIGGATVCVLFYLLTIKIHNFSLFHSLYAIVPGARAIRVGYRSMLVANLFAVTAIGMTFDRIARSWLREPRVPLRRVGLAAIIVLLSLAASEQVNLSQPSTLSRSFERQYMRAVGRPPPACKTFYSAPETKRAPYEVQNDAMVIALAQGLPTVNGNSSLNPPGWDFYDTNAPDYEQRAEAWAVKRGIAEGLCRVDVLSGAWTVVDLNRDRMCGTGRCVRRISFGQSHEFDINLAHTGNGGLFADDHWEGPEPWGRWTNATQAALSFSVDASHDLSVAVAIRPLLSPMAPRQTVWIEVNRCWIGGIEFDLADGSEPQIIAGAIPAACIDADGKVVLRINTDRARSPNEIGINGDKRQLGVGIEHVVIRESKQNEH